MFYFLFSAPRKREKSDGAKSKRQRRPPPRQPIAASQPTLKTNRRRLLSEKNHCCPSDGSNGPNKTVIIGRSAARVLPSLISPKVCSIVRPQPENRGLILLWAYLTRRGSTSSVENPAEPPPPPPPAPSLLLFFFPVFLPIFDRVLGFLVQGRRGGAGGWGMGVELYIRSAIHRLHCC